MKTNFIKAIFIIAVIFIGPKLFAQSNTGNITGIYVNEDDYINHKLSYTCACSATQDFIKLNDFLPSSQINIKQRDKKFTLLKKNVFGYQACNNKNFRFYNNKMYEIIDTAGFYLYSSLEADNSRKAAFAVKKYFFSKHASSPIQLLDHQNLEQTFVSNARFRYAVSAYLATDKNLAEYDSYSGTFKIKYLFLQSLK